MNSEFVVRLRTLRPWIVVFVLIVLMMVGGRGARVMAASSAPGSSDDAVRSVVVDGDGDDDDDDGGGDDDNGGDDDDDIKRYGRLEARPEGAFVGVWVISSVAYTATQSTEFKTEYGGFENGVCVEVEVSSSNPTVAKEIETEQEYKCSGRTDDDRAEGELYGVVSELPAEGGPGLWIIGSKPFSATAQTEFDREGGVFAVGVTVKVEFYTNRDGANIAKEIELKYPNGDDDDDDDDRGYGHRSGREGHFYGLIDGKPVSGTLGIWTIGGVEYLVDERTELDDDDDFQIGAWVKVLFVVEADGSRRAVKIDESDDHAGVQNPKGHKLVGFITALPNQGFNGAWKAAGVEFVADANTRFKEEHGLFAIGAYVEIEYVIADNVRRILEIETHVPPGAGSDDRQGRLEGIGVATAGVQSIQAGTWTIGGASYQVTAATQLDDTHSDFRVGALVTVNSYANSGGQEVATRISAINLANHHFLPQLQR